MSHLPKTPSTSYSPTLRPAIWFQFFNSISYQIFLGPPMVLYAKSLGASATLLGILASLTPLLTIFQIPAAHYLERIGFRRFILAGWGTRNLCVFGAALIPLAGFLDNAWKLWLTVLVHVAFCALRGAASGAWLPWLTELLPENTRAHYLSREQRAIQAGALIALLGSGLVFQANSTPREFSAVFLISAIGGAISLMFLNRVPDVHAPEQLKLSGTPVPWREIVTFPPFVRLVGFNLLFLFATGSLAVFTVAFLKVRVGLGENQIMLFLAISYVAGLLALPVAGSLLNRIGSRHLLQWALGLSCLFTAGWLALASGLLTASFPVIGAIFIISGGAGAAATLANLRLTINTMPEMGRTHFFAFFTVITSLCLGITPIVWGICIDAMHTLNYATGPHGIFEWNRYSVYFAAILLLTLGSLLSTATLNHER